LDCEKQLFVARTALSERYFAEWVALNRPYQPIFDFVKNRFGEGTVILTFKNRRAVIEICTHNGLTLSPSNVYAGDGGTGKVQNISLILDRSKESQIGFVDDSVTNLLELQRVVTPERIRFFHAR